MTNTRRQPEQFPKAALYGAAAVIFTSLALVTTARLTGYMENVDPGGTQAFTRDVIFKTSDNGIIAIEDAATGRPLGEFPVSENRFVRVVMSSLKFERDGANAADNSPYRIVRWEDGRVSVADPVSGRSIELAAFGRNQVATFENLLR